MTPSAARRLRLPEFLGKVVSDQKAVPVLVGAAVALFAVGIDPPILEPAMPNIQAAIRASPDLQSLLLVSAVWKAAALLVGGVLADVFRSRRLLSLGLIGLAVASLGSIVFADGPASFISRMLASFSVGVVLPFVIGAVGTAYSGINRATAIGIAYAAYGAANALSAPIALINGPSGPFTLGFAVCGVLALVALVVNRVLLPPFEHAAARQRSLIVSTALWAFGVTAIVASVINFRIDPLDWLVIAMGIISLVAGAAVLRRSQPSVDNRINVRPVTVVLAVGVVIGFAQIVPLLKLPQYFTLIQGLHPLVSTLAIAPLFLALLISGPISGWLLQRIGPRTLVAGGVISIGVADIALAAILVPTTSYLLFIVPFMLIGAGFVIATVVRTALIFASVPKQMPGSAAALNEASLGLGNRLGTIFATALATNFAISFYTNTLIGLSPEEVESRLVPLRELLYALGLPSFPEILALVDPGTRATYAEAALAGLRVSLLVPGLLAVATGFIAYFALGRRDPVSSVWDYSDERAQSV